MKKRKNLLAFILTLVVVLTCSVTTVFAASEAKWVYVGNEKTYYDTNGKKVEGFKTIDGSKYYFDPDNYGYMVKNKWEETAQGKWCYFGSNGKAVKGNQAINGKIYYFGSDFYMKYGWQKISGEWYYYGGSNDGSMKYGWQQVDGEWYYLGSDGVLVTENWQKDNGKWFYLDSDGAMVTGWQEIGGESYYFDADGAMHTGWLEDGDYWYFLNDNPGADEGKMVKGLWYINGNIYYFAEYEFTMNPETKANFLICSGLGSKLTRENGAGRMMTGEVYVPADNPDGRYYPGGNIGGYNCYFYGEDDEGKVEGSMAHDTEITIGEDVYTVMSNGHVVLKGLEPWCIY